MLLRYIESLEERKKILLACHVDATSGHMGKTRTIYRIKERFMWHGMVKDVIDLVRLFVYGLTAENVSELCPQVYTLPCILSKYSYIIGIHM